MTTDHQTPPESQTPPATPPQEPQEQQEPPQSQAPPPSTPPPAPLPSKEAYSLGLAITSLILGITSISFCIFVFGAVFAIIGIILGAVHLKKRDIFRAMAIWGIVLSSVGLLSSLGMGTLYYRAYREIQSYIKDVPDFEEVAEENWEGVIAPELVMTSLEGEQVKLSDLRDKRVVIDFWATWCPPCVKEIPHFIKLKEDPEAADLMIVGISSEHQEVLKEFVKKHGVNYMIASAKDEDLPSPYKDVRSIPTTFFVDRNGVIQTVLQGYHDYDKLKATALADDFQGEAKTSPNVAASNLLEADVAQELQLQWTLAMPGCLTMCAADWDEPGQSSILVADNNKQLHVINLAGQRQTNIKLPQNFALIAAGRHAQQGARLLGYKNWGKEVTVCDANGKKLWQYNTENGVNGAHWGDLDGDGTDEMIVGMNGGGGLHAVSADGKLRWKVTDICNVWNQAVVPGQKPEDCLVLATEAGGSIYVYDHQGSNLRKLCPFDGYYAQLAASVMDDNGRVQIAAIGYNQVVGFDQHGKVAWKTSGLEKEASWRRPSFTCGDLNGNGVKEWVFHDAAGKLVVCSPDGVQMATMAPENKLKAFVINNNAPGEKGLLITMTDDKIEAYALLPQKQD